MRNLWIWFPGLGLTISGVMAFFCNSVIAQITPDATLPTNSLKTQDGNIININGGTKSGSNLFHSFDQFSVPDGITANFQNVGDIQNIFSRVTGKSISDIQGILKADGAANLFLINPNGIVFGPKASLQIGGSFIGSTASSVNFADGTKFSATNPQTTPLLTVSVPIGLQFGATAAPILNQSQAEPKTIFDQPVGLRVNPGKTLALVGGDITLEGGNLTAESGRIELGSLATNSLVSLNPINLGWSLGYEGVQDFQNIQIIRRTVNGSQVRSIVDASSTNSGGSIQVRGSTVLIGARGAVRSQTLGNADGEDIKITSQKLIVQDGAQISTSTGGKGKGGDLIVNADESVTVIGGHIFPNNIFQPSLISSTTYGDGKAGEVNIKTLRLRIQAGGKISTEAFPRITLGKFIAGTGAGGNLIVTASESLEIIGTSVLNSNDTSSLLASTTTAGDAGQVMINTKNLIIRDGAQASVSSRFFSLATYPEGKKISGQAGNLNIAARSLQLDNKGKLISESEFGGGGNINLQVQNTLLMRRNSGISTSAGTSGAGGDGGNITINAPKGFIVATPLGNNDITANGFSGAGGNITINAKSVFGFVPRSRADLVKLLGTEDPNKLNPQNVPTSDITAFSQQNPSLNGVIQINTPDIDPKKLAELPENLIDTAGQIAAACGAGGKLAGDSFTAIGRGGVVADPTDVLTAEAVLTDWISLSGEGENRAGGVRNNAGLQKQGNTVAISQKDHVVNSPEQIVEAQGWVIDARGNVVLVAQAPTATPHSPGLKQADCAVR